MCAAMPRGCLHSTTSTLVISSPLVEKTFDSVLLSEEEEEGFGEEGEEEETEGEDRRRGQKERRKNHSIFPISSSKMATHGSRRKERAKRRKRGKSGRKETRRPPVFPFSPSLFMVFEDDETKEKKREEKKREEVSINFLILLLPLPLSHLDRQTCRDAQQETGPRCVSLSLPPPFDDPKSFLTCGINKQRVSELMDDD